MSNFVVSARKYRPSSFDTVVGQGHITTTLKNAIKSNHLAQAFLFCGPRGVGKTTCARILAKTINCSNITADTEACNECESCVSFNNGQSLNIFELDAASNNSVEDIRSLVDQVRFAPASGHYKIYIIDEVHMLSSGAFNAFLKTLEEPPPYAIFILATTEKHKIIPTILSRCQIFDFNRIKVEDISKHLQQIAVKENIEADPEALHIIAQKAEGALRDALSIFDQMVTFSGNKVTYKDVINNLNVLDYEYYFRITDQILPGNISSVLLTFNELLNEGFDGHHFIAGLSGHFRDLMVAKDEITLQLLEVTEVVREKYKVQSKAVELSVLLKLIDICNACDLSYKSVRNQRLHVEITLMKMCALSGKLTVNENAMAAKPVVVEKVVAEKTNVATPAAQAPKSEPAVVSVKQESIKPEVVKPETKINEPAKPEVKEAPTVTKAEEPIATISLSGLNAKKTTPDKAEPTDVKSEKKNDRPIVVDELNRIWALYADLQDNNGNTNLSKALLRTEPEVINETEIHVTVDNQVLRDNLLSLKSEFLEYFKKEMQNDFLTLEVRVEASEKVLDKPYTAREKFKKMAEKNPELENFRKQFDLNFD
ncbi:MAG TPA: DNA polymerase III subunit gamma/tau [Bacteroidia bacterium]|nr:DNA polymerase III subunit gamma/tau [Bacteroidia bacterium]MBP7714205.1 DNA polymerase III subunit gamma/tau [Bacteroidia bacterium]MBP8668143.1 DNA polymerase III subunit gamma/tau [Bacteroidia bacterium]HOZ89612.1 DNA polymerase III subunit gamma/tau [Bacteroidia bacterium]HQW18584.1 DNA polymerase III subunit gamma/tau [Bacteroidia bacterium]